MRGNVKGSGRSLLVAGFVPALLSGCGDDNSTGPTPNPPENRPPALAARADTSCAVGDTLRLIATAHDDEGDSLRFSAGISITYEEFRNGYLPAGGMNPETGAYWFAPNSRDIPGRRISVSVEDTEGGKDTTSFWVEVD